MRSDRECLSDIVLGMRSAVRFLGGRSFDEFVADELVRAGVERRLEIIGEATKRLSISVREAHPEIPWKPMAGMRDLLIHG